MKAAAILAVTAVVGAVASMTAPVGGGGWSDDDLVLFAALEREAPLARAAYGGEVVVCLLVDSGGAPQDAGTRFVERMSLRQRRWVRRGAECEARGSGSVEIATGAPAVLLTAGPSQWIGPDEAWVKVTRYRDRRRNATVTECVVREAGRWTAIGEILKLSPA